MIEIVKSLQQCQTKNSELRRSDSPKSDPLLLLLLHFATPYLLLLELEIALMALLHLEQKKDPVLILELLELCERIKPSEMDMLETLVQNLGPDRMWADRTNKQPFYSELQDLLDTRMEQDILDDTKMQTLLNYLDAHGNSHARSRILLEDSKSAFEPSELDQVLTVLIGVYNERRRTLS